MNMKHLIKVSVVLATISIIGVHGFAINNNKEPKSYQLCPPIDPNKINVHLIPHSHDDVGWLKTADEYYYGDKNNIQSAGVQYILDTVITALEANPERRFIYVEVSFFWRWWMSRDESVHQRVINLVNSGQLEFINGGWSMSDEGANYYSDLIDCMTVGFRFLNDTFGPIAVPKVAWHIDPFGHSRETASLFAQMGFDGIFLGRLDYQNKAERLATKTMEQVWNASSNLGIESQIFAGALYNEYAAPQGFCFDIVCTDSPIRDNPKLKGYNVDSKVDDFISYVNSQASGYATNNIIITMGEDFQYQDASSNFINLDKLIKYVNERQSSGSLVNAFYSTPSCYLKALNEASNTWTVNTGDYMPYASDNHAYWTGYFTSRPTFKGLVKYSSNVLQTAKQLTTLANPNAGNTNSENLETLKRFQGDAQHHDAIPGTAKQAVNDDYVQSLSTGLSTATAAINDAFSRLLPTTTTLPSDQQLCHYLNVSYCEIPQESPNFVITVYNPRGQEVNAHVRVPVPASGFTVSGPDGNPISSQVVPVPQPVLDDPERDATTNSELVFNVDIPPTGFSSFFIQQSQQPQTFTEVNVEKHVQAGADQTIQNEYLKVTVDGTTGLLKSITDTTAAKTYSVSQNFYYYQGMAGDNSATDKRASGAYIFRPNGTANVISTTATVITVTGTEVQEIQQTFSDYVSQVIRLYPGENKVELEWMIGPIPAGDNIGKEIISYYSSNLASDGNYYTDSNGREILQRTRNYRPTWNVDLAENISGNYYPVNSRIYIKDEAADSQLTIVTDRSQGGGSIQDGSIELMLHRRLLYDDAKGVAEALNEPGVDGKGLRVRGKHWLIVSSISDAAKLHRPAGMAAASPPIIFFAPLSTSVSQYISQFQTTFSGLTTSLPGNVHLLTLEPWKDNTILLRLEHFYEKLDDPAGLSLPVTVNIQNLFSNFQITSLMETTLGAHIWLQDNKHLSWNTGTAFTDNNCPHISNDITDSFDVTLTPMQIRTFVVTTTFT